MDKSIHSIRSIIPGSAVIAALALSARPALAETSIAADLDYAAPINSDVNSGGGFGARLGYQVHVPLVVVTPELAFTYASFSGFGDARVYRGLAGVRIGIFEVVRPGVYFHLGVGHLNTDLAGLSHTDLSYDIGAFLDFTLLPLLNVGAHAAYNRMTGDPLSLEWATVGGHVALVF
jgi:hypothetical protein